MNLKKEIESLIESLADGQHDIRHIIEHIEDQANHPYARLISEWWDTEKEKFDPRVVEGLAMFIKQGELVSNFYTTKTEDSSDTTTSSQKPVLLVLFLQNVLPQLIKELDELLYPSLDKPDNGDSPMDLHHWLSQLLGDNMHESSDYDQSLLFDLLQSCVEYQKSLIGFIDIIVLATENAIEDISIDSEQTLIHQYRNWLETLEKQYLLALRSDEVMVAFGKLINSTCRVESTKKRLLNAYKTDSQGSSDEALRILRRELIEAKKRISSLEKSQTVSANKEQTVSRKSLSDNKTHKKNIVSKSKSEPAVNDNIVVNDVTTKKTIGKRTVTKKSATKKTAAKKTVAKKTVAKKTVAKKSAAKKTVAKKTVAKKSAAKKTVAKKTVAKKSAAKKTVAKKSAAKKTVAKKSAAKKTVAKKSAAKKTVAKKTVAK